MTIKLLIIFMPAILLIVAMLVYLLINFKKIKREINYRNDDFIPSSSRSLIEDPAWRYFNHPLARDVHEINTNTKNDN